MNSFIIDNCVVSKLEGGISIIPIKLVLKKNPNTNINSIRKITYGTRYNDNKILSELSDGVLNFNDLTDYYYNLPPSFEIMPEPALN